MFKRYEDKLLDEIKKYIGDTYNQHYVQTRGDVVDMWEDLGSLETTARDTAIKYLVRYGKKGGYNPIDLYKAVHYIILMLYAANKTRATVTGAPYIPTIVGATVPSELGSLKRQSVSSHETPYNPPTASGSFPPDEQTETYRHRTRETD